MSKDDTKTAYFEFIEGLRNDDLDTLARSELSGGESTIIEVVTNEDMPDSYSASTWAAIFESLSDEGQTELIYRLNEHDRLSPSLLQQAINEEWMSKQPGLGLLNVAFEAENSDELFDAFVDHARSFSDDVAGWIETFIAKNDLNEEQFLRLCSKINEPADTLLEGLLRTDRTDLVEPFLEQYSELRERDDVPEVWSTAAFYSIEIAEETMKQLDLSQETWKEFLLDAPNSCANKALPFMVAYARQYDPDRQTLNDFLHNIFYHAPGHAVQHQVDALLEEGASTTSHQHYGQWLIEWSELGDGECAERFEDWLDDGGEINSDTIRLAFQQGTPRIVDVLQTERSLEQSTVHSAIGGVLVLDRDQDDAAREVGIIQVLNDEHLSSPSGEPSYFVELMQNIVDKTTRDFEPLGRALFEREVGGPERDEIQDVYELMIQSLKQTRSYEKWFTELTGYYLQKRLKPTPEQAERLRPHSPHIDRLFGEKLTRREQQGLNFQCD